MRIRALVVVRLLSCLLVAALALSANPAGADESEPVSAEHPELGGADQPVDDRFVAELRSDPNFAGAWIDADRVIHLAFKVQPGPIRSLPTGVQVVIEVGRSHSFSELVVEQRRLAESMGADSYVDEITGEVVVELLRGDDRKIVSSVATRVAFVDARSEFGHGNATCSGLFDCDDIRADIGIVVSTNIKTSGCSSGGIYKQGSNYYLLTAAHCGGQGATSGTVSHNGYVIGDFHKTSWVSNSTNGDSMSFKLRQKYSASRKVRTNDSGGYVDIVSWDSSVTTGEQVCVKTRNGLKLWNCSTVTSVSQTGCGVPGLIRSDGLFAQFGDSGSAVWGNGQHRGVFTCFQPYPVVAMIVPPSTALGKLGASISNGHKSYKPHMELRNRNFERSSVWSDWKLQGSGQRARYSSGGKDGAWTFEFNCFVSGCSTYQDTSNGINGYNPGDKFSVEAWVKCNSSSTCSVTLAMWINPNGSASLAGATATSISSGAWKKVTMTATVPSGVSGGQARWELYNTSSTGQNTRFSLPVWSRIP